MIQSSEIDADNFLSSNGAKEVDFSSVSHHKKKKKKKHALENRNVLHCIDVIENLGINSSDTTNHVKTIVEAQEIKKKKKKRKKHFIETEFQSPDVLCKNSEDQVHDSPNAPLITDCELLENKNTEKNVADGNLNLSTSSNINEDDDHRSKRKKKKKEKYAFEPENKNMLSGNGEIQELSINSPDTANHVDVEGQEIKRKKKRKKHFMETEFQSSGAICKNSENQVHDSLSAPLTTDCEHLEIKKTQNNVAEGNLDLSTSSNINEDGDHRSKRKKKRKEKYTSELEKKNTLSDNDKIQELSINSPDTTNDVDVEAQEIKRKKKRKKHFIETEFQSSGAFCKTSEDQVHDSLSAPLIAECELFKKKNTQKNLADGNLDLSTSSNIKEDSDQKSKRKKKKKEKYTSEPEKLCYVLSGNDEIQELSINSPDTANHVDVEAQEIKRKKKRKKNFMETEFQSSGAFCKSSEDQVHENDEFIDKDRIKKLDIISSVDAINQVETIFEDQNNYRKKKRKKERYFVNDEYENIDGAVLNSVVQLHNSSNHVHATEQSKIYKKKNHLSDLYVSRAQCDKDLNTNFVSLNAIESSQNRKKRKKEKVMCDDEFLVSSSQNRKKRKKEKVMCDDEFLVSDEINKDIFIENSLEKVKNKDTCQAQLINEDVTKYTAKDANQKLASTGIITGNENFLDNNESRFSKKMMKLKHSTPYPNKSVTSLSHNVQQLLSTLHNISSIVKPRNKLLDEETNDNQISIDIAHEKTTSFSDDHKKKIRHKTDANSCVKEKDDACIREDDCTIILTGQAIESPHGKKDLSPDEDNGGIKKQKETNLNKHNIHDKEPGDSKAKAPYLHLFSHPKNELHSSRIDLTAAKDFIVPELDNNEDPVDFDVPELHESESVNSLSKEKRDAFESKGIKIKLGRWSKSEDEILRKNYNEFCGQFKINDPCILLGVGQSQKNLKVVQFLKAKHFYIRLGKDLNNRTLNSIYLRARTLFHPLRNDIKCSKEDVSSLKQAYNIYGNKWNQIGDILDKKASQVRESYRWNQKLINKGKWTPEEDENLISAIKAVAGTSEPSSQLIKAISWEKVAELVPTRNLAQCRFHFGEKLARDPDVTELLTWNTDCTEKLFKVIKCKHYRDETEIDWESIYESFKNVAPSYMFLQKKYSNLKSTGKYFKTINNLFVK